MRTVSTTVIDVAYRLRVADDGYDWGVDVDGRLEGPLGALAELPGVVEASTGGPSGSGFVPSPRHAGGVAEAVRELDALVQGAEQHRAGAAVQLSELPRSRASDCPVCGESGARPAVPTTPARPALVRNCDNYRCPTGWYLTGRGGALLDVNPAGLARVVKVWVPQVEVIQ